MLQDRPLPTGSQHCFDIKEIRSARSFSFLIPAKTIFVPGIYFLGLIKYSNMCLSDQTMAAFLFASEYAKPSVVPDVRPITPYRGGPCFALPPFSMVWHCAHFALNSFAPFFTSPSGTSTSGSGTGIPSRESGRTKKKTLEPKGLEPNDLEPKW